MLNRDALEYLVSLGDVEVITVGNQEYSTKKLYMITEPKPAQLETTTLTALIDYIKSEIDPHCSEKLLIHIKSPSEVVLYSGLRDDAERETYMVCKALTPNNISFNRFLDTEQFNIMLQSSFVDNDDRKKLLKVTGTITDKAVKEVGDDGVSQAVTIKTGVATVNDVKVPNPVILAPYRTFPEIEQPESRFIFRMQSGPAAALYEADGGAWRNEAMSRIKEYLENQLREIDFVEIIS